MPITKTNYTNSYNISSVDTLFANRVVRIEQVSEVRNWSDTLDYTDMRGVTATYALVWLGTHGAPPRVWHSRPVTGATPSRFDEPRDLEFFEQFAWVDCTNMFTDRNGYALQATVDGEYGMFGEPLMWANLIAWESHHKAVAEKRAEELRIEREARAAAEAAVAAKKAAAKVKRDAKEAAERSTSEKLLARIPAKGTTVTVEGFTGKVFWVGVSKYRGKFNARAGVKNAKGEVIWVPAESF